jgi:hypothetical protein
MGLIAVLLTVSASASPWVLTHQGRLSGTSGAPVAGDVEMRFELHTPPPASTVLWTSTQTVPLTDGYFSVQLGPSPALDPAWFAGEVWLQVRWGATSVYDRPLASAPHALAAHAATGVVDASSLRLDGAPVRVAPTAACDDANRGALRFAPGAPGVADALQVCLRASNGTYGWVNSGGPDCQGPLPTWYTDADGDGFGVTASGVTTCAAPTPHSVKQPGDCDDTRSTFYPGSTTREIPNDGLDPNCDGVDRCRDLTCDGLPDVVLVDYLQNSPVGPGTAVFPQVERGWFSDLTVVRPSGGPGQNLSRDVESADFNLDGVPDLATDDGVFLMNGSGTAFSTWGGGAGGVSRDTDVHDLNGDGRPDVLHAVFGNAAGSILHLFGASGLTQTLNIGPGTENAIAAGDLDRDGFQDVVLCGTNVRIYWGAAGGGWPTAPTTTVGDACNDLILRDIDGDLDLDVITNRRVSRLTNRTLSTATFLMTGEFVGVGDVNGDGRLDVATADEAFNATAIQLWLGTAGGNFGDAIPLYTSPTISLSRPTFADLDGDGFDEVLVGENASTSFSLPHRVRVVPGTASGPDVDHIWFLDMDANSGAGNVTVADLDGDGVPEILTGTGPNSDARNFDAYVYWGSRQWDRRFRTELGVRAVVHAPLVVGAP